MNQRIGRVHVYRSEEDPVVRVAPRPPSAGPDDLRPPAGMTPPDSLADAMAQAEHLAAEARGLDLALSRTEREAPGRGELVARKQDLSRRLGYYRAWIRAENRAHATDPALEETAVIGALLKIFDRLEAEGAPFTEADHEAFDRAATRLDWVRTLRLTRRTGGDR